MRFSVPVPKEIPIGRGIQPLSGEIVPPCFLRIRRESFLIPPLCLKTTQAVALLVIADCLACSRDSITIPAAACLDLIRVSALQQGTIRDISAAIRVMVTSTSMSENPKIFPFTK